MMFGLVVFSTFFAEYLMPPVFWRFRDVKLFNWEFMSFPVLYCVVIHPSLKGSPSRVSADHHPPALCTSVRTSEHNIVLSAPRRPHPHLTTKPIMQ
jgi:hypothetical protein